MLPFTPFSDHCPLDLKVNASFNLKVSEKANLRLKQAPARYKWDGINSDFRYRLTLNTPWSVKKIDSIKQAHYSDSSLGINSMTRELTDFMKSAANHAMIPCTRPGIRLNRKKRQNRQHKECSQLEREIKHVCRLINRDPFDKTLRHKFYALKKRRRKLLKSIAREAQNNLITKLNDMYETDPKEYWNIVSQLEEIHTEKRQPNKNIPASSWLDHFKALMKKDHLPEGDCQIKLNNHPNLDVFSPLDFKITEAEIVKGINLLKRGKAPGTDSITNEMLKAGKSELAPVLAKLFNMILTLGCFPNEWAKSLLVPLFKGGSVHDPSDYRGISLSSCLGKLLCSILNKRLVNFLEENNIYKPNQIAFRTGRRTSDHIFVLQTLLDKYVKNNNTKQSKLFVCFVDLRKAFDTVWRDGLLYKLLEQGVGGNFYKVIADMYNKSKVSVKLDEGLTPEFPSNIGVKQGCVISPTLFNLYLNDLPDIFGDREADLPVINGKKVNCLMYADDIAILSTSMNGLQHCLDKLHNYCTRWHLNINTDKTKIVIFNKTGRRYDNMHFKINDAQIEIVKEMKYLGIVFNNNCSYQSATDNLRGKAMKALFKLYKSFGNVTPSIQTCIHLFEAMIKPILLYNSEIWGHKMFKFNTLLDDSLQKTNLYLQTNYEKMHLKWCKYTLGVHSKSTNIAVLAELGRYPLTLGIIQNMITYWFRLANGTDNILLEVCHKENMEMLKLGKSCWMQTIKDIMYKLDVQHLFSNPDKYRLSHVKRVISDRLRSVFDKQFVSVLYNDERTNNDGNKLRTFRQFKNSIGEEPYLSLIKNTNIRKNLCKLRISAHNLPVEAGRHRRNGKVPLTERKCEQCQTEAIGNEFHLIMACDKFTETRNTMFTRLSDIFPFFINADEQTKFVFIMSCADADVARELNIFLRNVINTRGNF